MSLTPGSGIALLSGFFLAASPAYADLRIVIIEESDLPYELGASNYDNSPSNYDNSDSNYENSSSNYNNSTSNYVNSASNYENSISGSRRLISKKDEFIGYYVFSDSGVLNFFNASGNRVAYKPASTRTQSVFSETGEWCGTMGNMNSELVLGVVEGCFYRFVLDN